jgi:hypothetical protein
MKRTATVLFSLLPGSRPAGQVGLGGTAFQLHPVAALASALAGRHRQPASRPT